MSSFGSWHVVSRRFQFMLPNNGDQKLSIRQALKNPNNPALAGSEIAPLILNIRYLSANSGAPSNITTSNCSKT
jgi:hypothetical protein